MASKEQIEGCVLQQKRRKFVSSHCNSSSMLQQQAVFWKLWHHGIKHAQNQLEVFSPTKSNDSGSKSGQ